MTSTGGDQFLPNLKKNPPQNYVETIPAESQNESIPKLCGGSSLQISKRIHSKNLWRQLPPNLKWTVERTDSTTKKTFGNLWHKKYHQVFRPHWGIKIRGDQAKKSMMEFLPTRLSTSFQPPFSHSLNTMANLNIVARCAKCGKGGAGLKMCKSCKHIKYCSVMCQRLNWPSHKKECKQCAAKLHDESLFKQMIVQSASCQCLLRIRKW